MIDHFIKKFDKYSKIELEKIIQDKEGYTEDARKAGQILLNNYEDNVDPIVQSYAPKSSDDLNKEKAGFPNFIDINVALNDLTIFHVITPLISSIIFCFSSLLPIHFGILFFIVTMLTHITLKKVFNSKNIFIERVMVDLLLIIFTLFIPNLISVVLPDLQIMTFGVTGGIFMIVIMLICVVILESIIAGIKRIFKKMNVELL